MYDDEIKSFVEAVEPDLSYQGTEGVMAMMFESAQNMIALEDFIHTDAYQEGAKEIGQKIWEKIKKFFKAIVELIKKFIAKIKSFFIAVRTRLTKAAAVAMKKLGEMAKNLVGASKETITYRGINEAEFTKFASQIERISKEDAKHIEAQINKYGADIIANGKEIPVMDRKDALDIRIGYIIKDANHTNFISKAKEVLFAEKTMEASKEGFAKEYKDGILSKLDKAYDAMMKAETVQLMNTSEVQKNIENGLKQNKVDDATANKIVKAAMTNINSNIAVHNTLVLSASQVVASVSMSAYKSMLAAVMRGIKARVKSAVKKDNKEEKVATESVAIL